MDKVYLLSNTTMNNKHIFLMEFVLSFFFSFVFHFIAVIVTTITIIIITTAA